MFRVEGTAEIVNQTMIMQWRSAELEGVTLAQIDPAELDDQSIVGIERGIFCLGMINTVSSATYRQLAIHLYRPGYSTIQLMADGSIRPWTRTGSLEWIPVADVVESEQAVDSLLAMNCSPYLAESRQVRETELSPGGTLPAHRRSLLFAATEYERIAWLVDDDEPEADATRERLRQKASRLRELADRD